MGALQISIINTILIVIVAVFCFHINFLLGASVKRSVNLRLRETQDHS